MPSTEIAPRLISQFTAQQNGLQFVETKLKNNVYAWHFTEISVRKNSRYPPACRSASEQSSAASRARKRR